jgi:hypothetical protein
VLLYNEKLVLPFEFLTVISTVFAYSVFPYVVHSLTPFVANGIGVTFALTVGPGIAIRMPAGTWCPRKGFWMPANDFKIQFINCYLMIASF